MPCVQRRKFKPSIQRQNQYSQLPPPPPPGHQEGPRVKTRNAPTKSKSLRIGGEPADWSSSVGLLYKRRRSLRIQATHSLSTEARCSASESMQVLSTQRYPGRRSTKILEIKPNGETRHIPRLSRAPLSRARWESAAFVTLELTFLFFFFLLGSAVALLGTVLHCRHWEVESSDKIMSVFKIMARMVLEAGGKEKEGHKWLVELNAGPPKYPLDDGTIPPTITVIQMITKIRITPSILI
ncbi:uncharacterized protein H6S33_007577 [Morchella sextelata]|uniref:uncharacterized protein n=1 Tax=Morchella sextelata TaxID=1174677 RepID=UPI001D03E532|nr:uncharacterized protein H6S33_007577 [Morchella sextelata]KAH0603918.1 hypothetical protein H6S33_007577 [Morchella sextelata]